MAGDEGLVAAGRVLMGATETVPLEGVIWRPPIPDARKLFALAGNYMAHIEEGGKKSVSSSQTPRVFMKPPSTTLRAHGDPIVLHRHARGVDYEAELAVVIGHRARYVKKSEAMSVVAGYSCLNDVSERKFRIYDRDETTKWDSFFDWLNCKWVDGFAPMGPALVTADEIDDPHELDIGLSVNGEERQASNTRMTIFDIPTIIEFISAFCTLEPGDIIATGTPAGVGDARGTYLADGDAVRVSIASVGVLENPVVAEDSA